MPADAKVGVAPAPRVQSAQGLESIFSPASVAVIGASPRVDAVGHRILQNILAGGFKGRIVAVHPTASQVLGVPAFPSVTAVTEPLDLAVIAVPAAAVCEVARECGKKGIRGLVVVSAGFREIGPAGESREAKLRGIAQEYGMRMIGPNCLGILNASPAVSLNATFATVQTAPGGTAVLAQSGALGLAVLDHAHEVGLGIARFASMGNKVDVSGNDLLLLWENEPDVRQIVMYLESFGNPRNFVQIASRVSRTKPILAVKAGRTERGARAALSHTGALAESDRVVGAILEQSGVLRMDTVEDLFDAAMAFDLQPLPAGGRVAIITNSGGPAIMAVDALAAAGLAPADLSAATLDRLRPILPEEASLANPLDLLASGGPRQYSQAMRAVAADAGVDAVIVVFTAVFDAGLDCARAIAEAAKESGGKPVLAIFFGKGSQAPASRELVAGGVPTYTFPESAVRALGAMHKLARFRKRLPGRIVPVRPDSAASRRIIQEARNRGDEWLRQDEALAFLAAYGVPTVRCARVGTEDLGVSAATWTGFPVVLKADVPGLIHKSDAGAVEMGLADAAALRAAFRGMGARLAARGMKADAFLVMQQAPPGQEMLLGISQHPRFGGVVAVGLGGIFAETLADVALRLAPVTDAEAARQVRSIRAAHVLDGLRGKSPLDEPALCDVVCRLSQLATDWPEVVELDINPFILHEKEAGGVAVDCRIRLARTAPP